MRHRRVLCFIDNSAARSVCIRMSSQNSCCNSIAALLAAEAFKLPTQTYYHRVPSFSNPADGPSRNSFDDIAKLLGSTRAKVTFPSVQEMNERVL